MPAYTTETVDTSGRRQVVAAVLFIVGALVTSYLPATTQDRVAAVLRSTVLRPFLTTQETITLARSRAVDTDALTKRLDSLVAAKAAEGLLAEENRRLRALLNLSQKLGPTFAPGTLVRAGTTGSESTFLVDVGTGDGIQANAPVLSAQGLIGVINEVQPDHSIGMDWSHPDFRAFAMSSDGATYGVVESRRGRFREDDRLVFNGTAFHTRLEDGTVIVTSGLGGIFPRGVPIGLIEGLAESEGGWRKSYWLRPLVEPGLATHVLVATGETAQTGQLDLSPVFPADSVMTEDVVAERERARVDSLNALGDTVRLLRQAVASYAIRDSLRLAGLSADSIARLAAIRARDSIARARGFGTNPAGGAAGGAAERLRGIQPTLAPAPQPEPPPVRAPVIRPALPAGAGGGAGADPGGGFGAGRTEPQPRPAVPQPRPAVVEPDAPARIRPADTAGARRLMPTDTIRLGPPGGGAVRPDTVQEGARRR
jgi:cell shape-determining protein MreC